MENGGKSLFWRGGENSRENSLLRRRKNLRWKMQQEEVGEKEEEEKNENSEENFFSSPKKFRMNQQWVHNPTFLRKNPHLIHNSEFSEEDSQKKENEENEEDEDFWDKKKLWEQENSLKNLEEKKSLQNFHSPSDEKSSHLFSRNYNFNPYFTTTSAEKFKKNSKYSNLSHSNVNPHSISNHNSHKDPTKKKISHDLAELRAAQMQFDYLLSKDKLKKKEKKKSEENSVVKKNSSHKKKNYWNFNEEEEEAALEKMKNTVTFPAKNGNTNKRNEMQVLKNSEEIFKEDSQNFPRKEDDDLSEIEEKIMIIESDSDVLAEENSLNSNLHQGDVLDMKIKILGKQESSEKILPENFHPSENSEKNLHSSEKEEEKESRKN